MLTEGGGKGREIMGLIVHGPWSPPGVQLVKGRSDPGLVSGEESDATGWELLRYKGVGE